MPQWQYCKIDLGALPRKASDIDILNELGQDGWELVNIVANNVAYLKRQVPTAPAKTARRTKTVAPEAEQA